MTRGRTALVAAVALAFVVAPLAVADEWRTFDGSWSATGSRQTVPTETGRAAIARFSGSIVLSGGGAGAGFAAEVIGFDDGSGNTTGRAVWTDSRGDRIFSTLRGGPLQTGRGIGGSITGGTGRWTEAAGEYSMTWQYLVSVEGDTIQGRSADLHGRIRLAGTAR
jgi:hypothetical protein